MLKAHNSMSTSQGALSLSIVGSLYCLSSTLYFLLVSQCFFVCVLCSCRHWPKLSHYHIPGGGSTRLSFEDRYADTGLKLSVTHFSHHAHNTEGPFAREGGGRWCLVKVHVCYESGKATFIISEMNVAFTTEGDPAITRQPEGFWSLKCCHTPECQ